MSAPFGIRPEQGPPLSVPTSFFLTAPLALGAAGVLLVVRGAEGATSVWGTTSVAVVHLGTVGFLLFVMLGALYQMLPVVAGVVVPWPRLGHGVHALLLLGGATLVFAQATTDARAFAVAAVLMTAAVALFLLPAGGAALRAGTKGPTARGLSLGLTALALVVLAGARLSWARAGHGSVDDWLALRAAHAHLGFLAWMGGLIASVSWQVLPMFFFAPAPPRALPWVTLGGVALSLALLGLAVFGVPLPPVALLALPGALAVWLVHPLWALSALRARKRRRRDATLWFWWLGLGAAPLCLALAVATASREDPRWPLAYGLVVLWGWAGAIAHGMLARIVPFLVWLHWCAPRVGQGNVPSAKELLPDREVAVGFGLHVLALALGLVAVASAEGLAWRAFGVALAATGAALLRGMVVAIGRGRPPAPPQSTKSQSPAIAE